MKLGRALNACFSSRCPERLTFWEESLECQKCASSGRVPLQTALWGWDKLAIEGDLFLYDHEMHLNAFLKEIFCHFLSPPFLYPFSLLSAGRQGHWLGLLWCLSCSAHRTVIEFSDRLTRLVQNILVSAYWQAWMHIEIFKKRYVHRPRSSIHKFHVESFMYIYVDLNSQ